MALNVNLVAEKFTSVRWLMAATVWSAGFFAARRQSWAVPRLAKLLRLTVIEVVAPGFDALYNPLLMTMTVRAPSARTAAKVDTSSGLGALARTAVSPKVERLAS